MDDPQLLRVSLPKPLGIQLEEVQAGSPGVRVAGVVEGGSAKEDGVRCLKVSWYELWLFPLVCTAPLAYS